MKNNELENLKNKDLTYFGYRIEPYFVSYLLISGMQNEEKSLEIFGFGETVRWLQLNNYLYQFTSDLLKVEKAVKSKLGKNANQYADYLIGKCLSSGEKLREESISFGKMADRPINKKEMSEALSDYVKVVLDYTIFYQITFFEGAVMQIAEKVIENNTKTKEEAEEFFSLISIADSLTAAEHEQDDFLRLAALPKNEQKKMAGEHAKKYGWLSVRYFIGDSWTKDEVLKRLETVDKQQAKKELAGRLAHRREGEKKIARAIKDFSHDDKQTIKQIRKIIYLRTQRGDFFHESAALIRPLLNLIAKELDVNYLGLINSSAPEIVLALGGNLDYKKHIRNRLDNFLIYYDRSDKTVILEGEEVESYLTTHRFLRMETENISEFSGKIGYKGKLRGVVKVVKANDDMIKVQRGDIIVTPMTTANLLPAMERASAFITDEGGITSHAAIIAREMRKPCIIGTKIATKVLKDGDMVEVDADRGFVKILKRK
ncbi:MAG: PEP-utilizing enzyme [bacterium]|nr:PEP-utilizing enzyme [bacterium]